MQTTPPRLTRGMTLLATIIALGGCAGSAESGTRSSSPTSGTAPSSDPTAIASSNRPTATPSSTVGVHERWIAYQAFGEDGGYGVHLVRPDGTGIHFAMSAIPGKFQEHPDWSPDGRRIVFSETETDLHTEDLWVADVDGSNAERMVDCQAPCVWADEPAWSPDGRSIVFQRSISDGGTRTSTLELLDPATKNVQILMTAPTGKTFYAPRWSPDGRSLVIEFATNGATIDDPPTADSIAIVDLRATPPTVRAITKASLLANNPDWSPRGDLIVFSLPATGAGFDGVADLYTIRPDGTRMTAVTSLAAKGGRAFQPTFTPDGDRIIFVREAVLGGDFSMASVLIDGTGLGPATSSGYIAGYHPRLRPSP